MGIVLTISQSRSVHTSIIRNPFVNFIPSDRVCPVTPERERHSHEVLMGILSKRKH